MALMTAAVAAARGKASDPDAGRRPPCFLCEGFEV